MNYSVDFNNINIDELFDNALHSPSSNNIFLELRRFLGIKLARIFIDSGLKILRTTLVDDGNVVNYVHGLYNNIPSLYTLKEHPNYSIGSLMLFTENVDTEISIVPSSDISFTDYSYEISKKKRKSFILISGIHFSHTSLNRIINGINPNDFVDDLVEIRLGYATYPIMFASKYNGNLFTCECFKGYIDWQYDFFRSTSLEYYPRIKELVDNMQYVKGICHLCTRTTPSIKYGNFIYYSGFLQRYLPYQRLEYKKRFGSIYHLNHDENKEIENELRVYFGYPKIGERWTSETILFNLVCEIFATKKVLFHYRGKELDGLEIDVWIPELSIGFEYQGEQHFYEVKHWGGKSGLNQRIANDVRKKEICKSLNYCLIEIFYHEELSKESIIQKLDSVGI